MDESLEICSLGRLIEQGVIKAGLRNEGLIRRWNTARWIVSGMRRAEWVIRPEAREEVKGRLERLLPDWQQQFAFLRAVGSDPFVPASIEALPMLRRQTSVSVRQINRRNWNAAAGLGPKHKAKVPSGAVLTKDWVLRFRPNLGLLGVNGTELVDFYAEAKQRTECVIPERAWLAFTAVAGITPRLIVTCENVGAYIDFPATDTTLVIYSPGADIEAAASLLRRFPMAPWFHFGDLDQEGIEIGKRLATEVGKPFRAYIPSFAMDFLDDAARPTKTPWKECPDIPILLQLKSRNRRLFQEVFMLDTRLANDVANQIPPE